MTAKDRTELAKEIAKEVIANQPAIKCPNGINAKTAGVLMDFANMWQRGKITMMTAVIFLIVGGIGTAVWYCVKLMAQSNIVRIAIISAVAVIVLTGCAGYKVNDDGSMSSWGVLRTLTVRKDYHPDGKLKTEIISTDSTSKDVLCGLNELIDSAAETAAKLK